MHILLTDLAACPRCGPEFGLILLADQVRDRQVDRGSLGCPNCRDRFPIADGIADLRPPPRTGLPELESPPADPPEPIRVAAFLGIPGGPGTVLLGEGAGYLAGALAGLIEGVHWVSADATGLDAAGPEGADPGAPGVNRMVIRGRIPFFSRSLRGVVLGAVDEATPNAPAVLSEAARAVGQMGRVVVLSAGDGVAHKLEEAGLNLVLEQDGVVVAARKS